MPSRRPALAATGLALSVLAAAITGCGGSSAPTGSPSAAAPSAVSSAAGSAASPASAASRAADVAFAQMMVPHHEQAIEMADLALAPAAKAGPDVVRLATAIKAAQAPEIATMNGWLASWGAPDAGEAMSGHAGHMMGVMSEDEMRSLAASSGPDFDAMWLTMMITHHEGAVTMAQDVLGTTSDPAVRTLAGAVVKGQKAEIDTMQGLLAR